MDGPNVNWATFDKITLDVSKETGREIYNVGSCGLHIMHNAFKTGYCSTDWDIEHKLNSLFWLFKDSPARREDFTTLTGCTLFAKKFCSHRWLENVSVCKRALEIWPHVVRFVDHLVKNNTCPQTKSFSEVRLCSADPMFSVRLNIFISVAGLVEPFLAKYQSDKPMLPFMADDMREMVVSILERVLKDDPTKVKTVSQLFVLTDSLSNIEMHKEPAYIDIGYVASSEIKDLKKAGKVSEKCIYKIRLEAKAFMILLVNKLLEKAPIRYGLIRHLSWMLPSTIVQIKASAAKQSLKYCLDYMVLKKRVKKDEVDNIVRQYGEFSSEKASCSDFLSFNRDSDRLDMLFFSSLSTRKEWKDLWAVVKEVLMLSHGQAGVERGFSLNKEIMTDNMKQKTLTAQRIIADHIINVGGASRVSVTKTLLFNAACARSRYEEYLKEEKKKYEEEEVSKKRKLVLEEIEDLKVKKRKLETCEKDMTKSSNDYAEKAEKTQSFTFLAKSNSLRRSAKEKSVEAAKLGSLIDEKLQAIKNQ